MQLSASEFAEKAVREAAKHNGTYSITDNMIIITFDSGPAIHFVDIWFDRSAMFVRETLKAGRTVLHTGTVQSETSRRAFDRIVMLLKKLI